MNREELQKQFMDILASGRIQPATIIFGDNVQNKIEKVEAGGVVNITGGKMDEQQPDDMASKRGRREIPLFITSSNDEDLKTTEEEANRFINYLKDHNLSQRLLDSSKDNPISKAIISFCYIWKRNRYQLNLSASAVLRFLTQSCGIQCDSVDQRAISNVLSRMLKANMDKETYYDVQNYF